MIATIVEHTVQNLIWIKQKQFADVFQKIQALFMHEKLEKYYNEKAQGDGEAYPGGQLFSHYKYMHSFVKKELGIRVNRKIKKTKEIVELPSILTPVQVENMRRDLIGRQEPWDRILRDWEKTAPNRRNEMVALRVAATIPRWPKYKKKQGFQLVSV